MVCYYIAHKGNYSGYVFYNYPDVVYNEGGPPASRSYNNKAFHYIRHPGGQPYVTCIYIIYNCRPRPHRSHTFYYLYIYIAFVGPGHTGAVVNFIY